MDCYIFIVLRLIANPNLHKNTGCPIKDLELDVASGAILTLRPWLLRPLNKEYETKKLINFF